MRVWIVLPAYNEERNIPSIFEGLRQLVEDSFNVQLRVVVVNDHSSDRTSQVARECARELPLQIIENQKNMELAATFMAGMMHAVKEADGADIIVCMDADNSHIPGQILQMARNIREGRDVVIASRFRPGAVVRGVPFSRRFLSFGLMVVGRVFFPVPNVRDYSCGYRAYRADLLKKAISAYGEGLFASEGFACMVGLLLRLKKLDAVFGEIPIVLRYDQKRGSSKMNVMKTIMNTLRVLLKERFDRSPE